MNPPQNSFAKAYNSLEQGLHSFSPEDTDWFFPALNKLFLQYPANEVWQIVLQEPEPLYCIELLCKAGVKAVDQSYLEQGLLASDEDQVYSAAFSLAACSNQKGKKTLMQFARGKHPLQKHLHPLGDVAPDLAFLPSNLSEDMKNAIRA